MGDLLWADHEEGCEEYLAVLPPSTPAPSGTGLNASSNAGDPATYDIALTQDRQKRSEFPRSIVRRAGAPWLLRPQFPLLLICRLVRVRSDEAVRGFTTGVVDPIRFNRGNVPVRTSRIGTLIIDAADMLAAGGTSEERWWAIHRLATKIGASAASAAGFQKGAREVAWARSTMDPLWLEEYEQSAFYEVDPLLHAALDGALPPYYDIAAAERGLPTSEKLSALNKSMLDYGYNFMIAHSWFDEGSVKCVGLSCREDPKKLFGPGSARAFSAVSAMMATALIPPGDEPHEGWAYGPAWQPLLPKERHVLSLIANGLPEYLIGDAMKVTEFEVWRLIRAASQKMKARSREQALALAIARGQVVP